MDQEGCDKCFLPPFILWIKCLMTRSKVLFDIYQESTEKLF